MEIFTILNIKELNTITLLGHEFMIDDDNLATILFLVYLNKTHLADRFNVRRFRFK